MMKKTEEINTAAYLNIGTEEMPIEDLFRKESSLPALADYFGKKVRDYIPLGLIGIPFAFSKIAVISKFFGPGL